MNDVNKQNTISDNVILEEIALPTDIEMVDIPVVGIVEENYETEEIPTVEAKAPIEQAQILDADIDDKSMYNLNPDTFLKDLEDLY